MLPITRCNAAGKALIKEFEGCAFRAYQDMAGIWTIGYGSTSHVTPGLIITQAQADRRLDADLVYAENVVYKQIKAILTDNQFSSLVSFVFNEGPGHLNQSTVKRLLNSSPPDYAGAADALLLWDKVRGCHVAGLLRRRIAERDLFVRAD